MKCFFVTIFMVFALITSVKATEGIELEGLNNPSDIIIKNQKIYVIDGTTVNIFTIKDYSKITSFGKSGTGPGEFQSNRRGRSDIEIYPDGDKIIVYNRRRHLYFSNNGKYQMEKNIGKRTTALSPFDGGFLGTQFGREGKTFVMKFLWFDADYNPGKTLDLNQIDAGRRFRVFGRGLQFTTIGKRIYIANRDKPEVNVLDKMGKKYGKITVKTDRRSLNSEEKREIKEHFKSLFGAERYKRISRFMNIPEKYPPFLYCDSDSENLYLITWNLKEGKNEVLVYNKQGKLVKRLFLKIQMASVLEAYPMEIFDGKLFQLVENDETEEWDLYRNQIL